MARGKYPGYTLDNWIKKMDERLRKELEVVLGPIEEGEERYLIDISHEPNVIPRSVWSEDEITQTQLIDYVLPKMFSDAIDFAYCDLGEMMFPKFLNDQHTRGLIQTMRAGGMHPRVLIMERIYDLTDLNIDIKALLDATERLTLVGEVNKDWKVRNLIPITDIHKVTSIARYL